MDIRYSNESEGAKVWMWGGNGTLAQKWKFTQGGYIESKLNGLVLEVVIIEKEHRVRMHRKANKPSQHWDYKSGHIVSHSNNMALQTEGGGKGCYLCMRKVNDKSSKQLWILGEGESKKPPALIKLIESAVQGWG